MKLWARVRQGALIYEQRVLWLALMAGLPGASLSTILLLRDGYSARVLWTCGLVVGGSWVGFAFAARGRVVRPLRTLANLLEAVREGDYSIRARHAKGEGVLGEVMQQINEIGATLRMQRLGAVEATALLRKVMEEIDVAVFAFDAQGRLRLVNRAGERLMASASERLLGRDAEALELEAFLHGPESQTVPREFPGAAGRWGIRRSTFREGGLPHQLLVLQDLTRPLREEELQAWQRLVRVLGHELNNSLTPIKSIAGSLNSLLKREQRADDWEDDMAHGLGIIASRAEALGRFIGSYARLAKLPPPRPEPVEIGGLIRHVTALETRLAVSVRGGPALVVQVDRTQAEQALINLVKNAVEASLELQGGVEVSWRAAGQFTEIVIEDQGRGLANTANLFVPFFTTKPGGTGIGLVLTRQIAEAHGGSVSLENRTDGPTGCVARLLLPL